MRSDIVVVGGIGLEDLAQVGVAKDNHVIQAFSADRANQPVPAENPIHTLVDRQIG
jgi:hypothetical protein